MRSLAAAAGHRAIEVSGTFARKFNAASTGSRARKSGILPAHEERRFGRARREIQGRSDSSFQSIFPAQPVCVVLQKRG